jgi:hypothetical protein
MSDTSGQMRVVVYYAVWATICAAVAGSVVAIIHPSLSGFATALELAAGQGVVALVTGALLARLGRSLNFTVLLGLALGLFDFVMYLLQMLVPATELGWGPDIAILVGATVLVTVLGSRRVAA